MALTKSKKLRFSALFMAASAVCLFQFYSDPIYGTPCVVVGALSAVAALGLILGNRVAGYLAQVLLVFAIVAWVWVILTYSVPNWPYTDALSSIISLIPGGLLVSACLVVIAAIRGHFRSHAV